MQSGREMIKGAELERIKHLPQKKNIHAFILHERGWPKLVGTTSLGGTACTTLKEKRRVVK